MSILPLPLLTSCASSPFPDDADVLRPGLELGNRGRVRRPDLPEAERLAEAVRQRRGIQSPAKKGLS